MYKEFVLWDFNSQLGTHCCFSPISNIFRYWIKDFDDGTIFLKYKGLLTEYKNNCSGYIHDIILSNHISSLYKKYFESYSIYFESHEYSGTFEDLLEEIKMRVKLRLPLILSQNSLDANYHRVYSNSRGNTHYITALGVKNNHILINDCFIPTNPVTQFQGYIEMDSVKKAWISSGKKVFLMKQIHVDSIYHALDIDLIPLLKSEITQYLTEYSRNLTLFASDVRNLLSNYTVSEIEKNIFALCFKLQFDSVIPSRRELLNVLKRIEYISPDIIVELDGILSHWFAVSFSMMKYGVIGSRIGFCKLADRINSILDQENKLLFQILNTI